MKENKTTLTFGVELKHCSECEAFLASQRETARWGYRAPRYPTINISQEMCCSACGGIFPKREGDHWSYCPRCGAKMRW